MFISPAFAQASGGLAEGGFGLLPIIFVMVIFYFLLIRPQQKRAKQHKEMLGALRRGDKIITSGGLTGSIVKVVEDSETSYWRATSRFWRNCTWCDRRGTWPIARSGYDDGCRTCITCPL